MFFAIAEVRDHSSHKENACTITNCHIGGYKYLKRALNSLLKHYSNGYILDENRNIVVLIQNNKITYPR